MNFTPYLTIWSLLAAVVVALAVYRKFLSVHEDDSIHVSECGARLIPQQIAAAQRIAVVEKWGKTLTLVLVLAGLVLATIYFHGVWASSSGVAVVQ